jgi:hypothetical protein
MERSMKKHLLDSVADVARPVIRPDPPLKLLDEGETSAILNVRVSTLQKLRVSGGGVPFVKVGRLVRYRLSDVITFIESRVRTSTSAESL